MKIFSLTFVSLGHKIIGATRLLEQLPTREGQNPAIAIEEELTNFSIDENKL